jgi:hypothetical protein
MYAIERGVTFFILIICATCFLTLAPLKDFLARLLFWIISVPSPSPSTTFAEEGDVNTALYPCVQVRLQPGHTSGTNLNEYFTLKQTLLQIIRIGGIAIVQVGRKGEIRHNIALRAISNACPNPGEQ